MLRHAASVSGSERMDDVSSSGMTMVDPGSGRVEYLPTAVSTPYLPGWYARAPSLLPPLPTMGGRLSSQQDSSLPHGRQALFSAWSLSPHHGRQALFPAWSPLTMGGRLSSPHGTRATHREACTHRGTGLHTQGGIYTLRYTHHGREVSAQGGNHPRERE